MLPRKYKLKKHNDFNKVFKQGKYLQDEFIKLKILKNDLAFNRFGLIIGLKISKKAVQRNKIKRNIEQIIQTELSGLKKGFDIIIMPSPEIVDKDYQEIGKKIINLFKRAKILETWN